MNVFPNIYEAYRNENIISKDVAVKRIFPSTQTEKISQIAYYFKKQSLESESNNERVREDRLIEISRGGTFLGKKNGPTNFRVVLNSLSGFPLVYTTDDLQTLNATIASVLGVKVAKMGKFTITQDMNNVKRNINGIVTAKTTRKDKHGFDANIYITKYNKFKN